MNVKYASKTDEHKISILKCQFYKNWIGEIVWIHSQVYFLTPHYTAFLLRALMHAREQQIYASIN